MSSAPKSSARSASLRGRLLPAVRLGVHHCAHLRAVAEGVSIAESAARYLGIEHAASAPAAHRAAVDLAAAVARRRGDVRWRLLGLPLSPALVAPRSGSATPTLEEWAALKGYEDWSIAELQELYREQFPVDDTPDRRTSRNARLLRRRLRLIAELEASAAVRAQPEDLLAGWLSPALAEQLRQRGVFTLRQLQILIGIGGRWWTPLPGVGPLKARRLAALVAVLLPSPAPPVWRVPPALAATLAGRNGTNCAPTAPGREQYADDRAAVAAWISARAGSTATKRVYEREADRFLLWVTLERGRPLSSAESMDCRAYMEFLAAVPEAWQSRRRVARFAPGWAPFASRLSVQSQQQAIDIVSSLFSWLVKAGYLSLNPWDLVRTRLGDDPTASAAVLERSRAFSPVAWQVLIDSLDSVHLTPAAAVRMRWLLVFSRATQRNDNYSMILLDRTASK